jgi:hypothetical protein
VSFPLAFSLQISDFELVPVLTPSVVQRLPNVGTSAELATASGVITSAAATVATTPARSEAKALCPLVFIFILALEGLLLFTIL